MSVRNGIVAKFEANSYSALIISTKAGGTGINLVSANRVVIFDSGFNPTWEEQAIGRAYRLGQVKPVFVYRMLVGGTFEMNLYNKQLFKTSLAQRVVDRKQPGRKAQRTTASQWLYEPKDVAHEDLLQWKGKDPSVLDHLIDRQMARSERDKSMDIAQIKTMETLQAEETETLTEGELLAVEEERQLNRTLRVGRNAGPVGAADLAAMPSTAPQFTTTAPAAPAIGSSLSMSRLQRPPRHSQAQPGTSGLPARDIRNQHQMGNGASGSATQVPWEQQERRPPFLGGLPNVRRERDFPESTERS